MNSLQNDLLNGFNSNLPAGTSVFTKSNTPKWLYCSSCGLENEVTENSHNGKVFQRVTQCPACKWINFNNE